MNLGNYESVRVGAAVEFDTSDFPEDVAAENMAAVMDECLDDLLRRDLAEALANVPEGKSTHLETWQR